MVLGGQGADADGKYRFGEKRKAICEMKHFDACKFGGVSAACCLPPVAYCLRSTPGCFLYAVCLLLSALALRVAAVRAC